MMRLTKQFGHIKNTFATPHLLGLQLDSYKEFLQEAIPAAMRANIGLEEAFRSVFPIHDFNRLATLEFVSYDLGTPVYDIEECLSKGLTYEAPLRIKVRLVVFDIDEETESKTIRDIKEQDVYFGTVPLITDKGTFLINGTERVVVNQLQRSPGILFEHDSGRSHASRKILYSCRVIPLRGSWLDFDFDHKDILYVRIDRRRKMPATLLLKAMGMSATDILDFFYDKETFTLQGEQVFREVKDTLFRKEQSFAAIVDSNGKEIVAAGKPITKAAWKKMLKANIKEYEVERDSLLMQFVGADIVHPETGEVLLKPGDELNAEHLQMLLDNNITSISCLFSSGAEVSTSICDTLALDKCDDIQTAQLEIYKRLRPSSPPTQEVAASFFDNIFRNPDYYDLSPVGRYKLNLRLNLNASIEQGTLSNEDILSALKLLVQMKDNLAPADDIDHLGNRRVRPVGELVENQYRMGLVRMERAIKERMSLQDISTLMPHDLINPKPVIALLKEFFGTSQLSQFMDQTNPLSEITHKRRLSALGPGGLTRERAGFEVRDVHLSHYGRICPIETPEGPNIGLIVSLTTHGLVNKYGFIETPYREVVDGKLTEVVRYLEASQETNEIIAQATIAVDDDGNILNSMVAARVDGELAIVPKGEVTLIDISPSQTVSISAALIPFLEHDDANRALMGSNMQRQAVPLLVPEAPIVGTGMEGIVAKDSGSCLLAEADGVVYHLDADRIIVRYDGDIFAESAGTRVYELQKFHKSNQSSCFGQKVRVLPGQLVKKGEVLADGPAIDKGELALGKNLLVAFMPWCGYNYEDSILISERMVKDDTYTSIHIEEFEVFARDTKLGPEEITRDISNVGEESLKDLDESGIICIGARVKSEDILVGKITPKGETQLSPEDRLLRAIFGDKARDVKNTSLKVPPGIEGTVIDVKVFNRRSGDKDLRTKEIEQIEIERLYQREEFQIAAITDVTRDKIWASCENVKLDKAIIGKKNFSVDAGMILTRASMAELPIKKLIGVFAGNKTNEQIQEIIEAYDAQLQFVRDVFERKRKKVSEGEDLPPGVIRMVKVYIAVKRKLSVGDKMAGRHGNKGVVSNILPEEDMPFFADGTPVDVVLNPLGVPSRMNIGQIMETHLGWAGKELGKQLANLVDSGAAMDVVRSEIKDIFGTQEIANLLETMNDDEVADSARKLRSGIMCKTPVFDGANEDEIWSWLERAGLPSDGKSVLYDGRTGESFDNRVTVGYMYYLKLHHLVDEKIHARSTGPYSLVTQQPLGGKAQFGGQRLGEMEVWALEAYGAAYILQEFLTVKSDDVLGRVKMYEKIVKGNNFLESGMPESFNVLAKEMMSLGLDVSLAIDGN